jgi:type I restriction enzyme, S subunit
MYGAGGQKRIPEDFIKDFRAGIPPLPEQEKIIAYINEKNGHSQEQFNKASEAIEKLKEYRSALITLAVTGKIDVRDVKIPEAPAEGKAA